MCYLLVEYTIVAQMIYLLIILYMVEYFLIVVS